MKKTAKKLTLSRETLRHLEEGTLPKAIGAAIVATQVDCSFCVTSCTTTPTVRTTCRCTAVAATCTTTA